MYHSYARPSLSLSFRPKQQQQCIKKKDVKQSPGTISDREQLTETLFLINALLPNLPQGLIPPFATDTISGTSSRPGRKVNAYALSVPR